MLQDCLRPHGLLRQALAVALVTTFTGCATAPGKPQWIAVTMLTPTAPDQGAPWFPRAATLVLRDELAAIPGLMVIVPPPTGADSAVTQLPPQVTWIAGGTVRTDNGRTRFDITLQWRAQASVSWRQHFDYPAGGDSLAWRQDISGALASRVGVRPEVVEAPRLGGCRSESASANTLRAIEAYGHYRSRDDLMRVRGWLEQALEQEPGCPEALAHHAMTHVSELANRWSTDPKAQLAMADQLSLAALAANPRQPYAHMARVQLLRMQGRVADAVEAAKTLTRLDPSNGLFVGRLAALEFDAGHAAATLAAARAMQGLPNGTLAAQQQGMLFEAMALYSMGQEEHAVIGLRKLLELNPQNGLAWQLLAGIEAVQGRDAEASAALQRFIALAPSGQTIRRLRNNETTVEDGQFQRQRERFYAGLRRAGLPE